MIAMATAWYVLAKDPPPGWPINLIHLLSRHWPQRRTPFSRYWLRLSQRILLLIRWQWGLL